MTIVSSRPTCRVVRKPISDSGGMERLGDVDAVPVEGRGRCYGGSGKVLYGRLA